MVDKNIRATVEELRKISNIENFIGDPIETDDKMLIPVMRMGFGFGSAQNMLGKENNDIVGAGAGMEPVSMVIVPKTSDNGEGIRVINLTSGNEVNKALSDLGLVVSDLIKEFVIKPTKEDEEYDEGEYINPTTTNETEEE